MKLQTKIANLESIVILAVVGFLILATLAWLFLY